MCPMQPFALSKLSVLLGEDQIRLHAFVRNSLFINLVDASLVSATFKLSGQPGVNDGDCFFLGHLALANSDHIAVTVLFLRGPQFVRSRPRRTESRGVCWQRWLRSRFRPQ